MLLTLVVPLLLALGASATRRSRASVNLESRATRWEYKACYFDSGSQRALTTSAPISGITPENCQAKCQSLGFSLAGMENGWDCFCGNALTNGGYLAPESSCSSPCRGDSSKTCGGSYRLSIYQSTTVAPVNMGCYGDDSDRTLKGTSTYNGALTPGFCFDYCGKAGYTYAGLENGAECWCSNTAPLASRKIANGDCSTRCGGDQNSFCGAPYRLNVYSLPTCDKTVTSQCVSGSSPTTTTSKSSAVSTTSVKPSTTSNPTTTSGAYVGCYGDASDRTLGGANTYSTSLTQKTCFDFCSKQGFVYAGMEAGGECYCGTTDPAASRKASEDKCSARCNGDSTAICGGTWYLSVYRIGSATTTTAITTGAPTATATGKVLPSGLNAIGCFKDAATLGFTAYTKNTAQTPATCVQYCIAKGYNFAGTQLGSDCYCSNKADWSSKQADTDCKTACAGDSGYACGGSSRMNVYSGSSEVVSGVAQPAAGGRKFLWAHHMVGNTISYTSSIWQEEVRLASGAGIDGFALNMGQDSWQLNQIATAYSTATQFGSFKMFLSFDMTVMACGGDQDARNLAAIVSKYAAHPNQAIYQNKVLVTTFAGDQCRFGRGSALDGWNYFRSILTGQNINIYLMPSLFVDVYNTWYDGHFDWDSAWPKTAADLDTSRDQAAINTLKSKGKGYMAGISPAFFTYYGTSGQFAYNKNWIYKGDNWLMATRFEMLMGMRGQLDMIELQSWNESHYIGPIRTDQPGSQGWVNGMPHTAWLNLIAYYAPAWKNGAYPSTKDQIIVWSRPHPKNGSPTNPTLGRPRDSDWTTDNLYALVLLSAKGDVDITSGGSTITFTNLPAGVTKISLASRVGAIGGQISRSGQSVTKYSSDGEFSYNTNFRDWNFNYFVQSF